MSESKKLWGGRFEGKTDPGFAEFNNSFRFDRRLFEADVVASIAYCTALEGAGVLTAEEGSQIRNALEKILEQGRADESYFNDSCRRRRPLICRSATDRTDRRRRSQAAHRTQSQRSGRH